MRKSRLSLNTGAPIRDMGQRQIVIEWSPENPGILTMRASGRRQRFALDLATLYTKAAGSADIPKGRKAYFKERKT